jgi:hypothetical protein
MFLLLNNEFYTWSLLDIMCCLLVCSGILPSFCSFQISRRDLCNCFMILTISISYATIEGFMADFTAGKSFLSIVFFCSLYVFDRSNWSDWLRLLRIWTTSSYLIKQSLNDQIFNLIKINFNKNVYLREVSSYNYLTWVAAHVSVL